MKKKNIKRIERMNRDQYKVTLKNDNVVLVTRRITESFTVGVDIAINEIVVQSNCTATEKDKKLWVNVVRLHNRRMLVKQ